MATIIDEIHYYCFFFFILWFNSTFLIRSFFNKSTTTHVHLPPTHRLYPSLVTTRHWSPSPPLPTLHESFHNLSNQYGPLLYLRLGSSRCLLVFSASVATEIFKTQDLAFSSRPRFAFADELPYAAYGFITAPYGDYWRFIKKLCITELLGTRLLERSHAIRREEVRHFLGKVFESASKGEAVDVGGELMRLTNNVTCRMVMSRSCSTKDGEADKCIDLVKESFEIATKLCFGDVLGPLKRLGFWLYGKKAMDVTRRYDELLEKILKEYEESGEREEKDLIDILLEVYVMTRPRSRFPEPISRLS